MNFEIQRASLLKRVSAFLLDMILVTILATGGMFVLSGVTGYDGYAKELEGYYTHYAREYNIETFEITQKQFEELSQEEKDRYHQAYQALTQDEQVLRAYSMVTNLSLLIPSLGIFFAFAVLEFGVPLLLKNGQTVGKKVFALGVIRCDGVKASTFMLFARTLLGKFTVETMLPILLLFMNGLFGMAGLVVIGLMGLFQLILLFATKNRTVIHDAFAQTVVVDLPSQRVFDTPEDLLAYKTRLAAEKAARADY